MIIASYRQDPDERKRYTIDYSNWLDEDETIVDFEFDAADPVTAPALTIDGAIIDSDSAAIIYFISGGDAGETYTVTLRITTSGGQVKEDAVRFQVRNT